MLAKTLVVFYVWSPDIFVLSFCQNMFSGIAYSIMSNKTLPYHTIERMTTGAVVSALPYRATQLDMLIQNKSRTSSYHDEMIGRSTIVYLGH